MAFKFYIDDQLTDQPDNDTELVTTIKRDETIGGLVITQDVTLVYSATNATLPSGMISGYAYLKSIFDSGTCNLAELKIFDFDNDGAAYRIYTGVINIVSIEIQEQPVRLSVKIDDNSYFSYLKNNGNIPFNLFATKTKNGIAITPPDVYEVDMFDSATGALLGFAGNYWKGFRLYDVLSFMVQAVSDNKVTFQSDYLLSNSFGIELFIFDGFALANADAQPNITVSFNQIIGELRKLKNVEFYIDQSDPDAPIFRLEEQGWFYIPSDILTFNEPLNVTTTVKDTKIYGTIHVGSEYNPGGAGYTYPWNAGASYFGWKDETYTPFGQCNNENELNLFNEFIIASNAVNDQVLGATESNLDSVFLVECWLVDDVNFTAQATDYDTYAPAPERYYNIGLNNVNKIALHGGNFQSALTNTANAGTDICHIELGTEQLIMTNAPGSPVQSTFTTPAVVVPVPFADEFGGNNYDPNGNWDSATDFCYTAPATGNYSFQCNMNLECNNFKECTNATLIIGTQTLLNVLVQYAFIFTIDIEVYTDNTFTTLLDIQNTNIILQNGTHAVSVSLATQLTIGNAVRARAQSQLIRLAPAVFGNSPLSTSIIVGNCSYSSGEPKAEVIALTDSSFVCNGTPEGGLVLASPDPSVYKIKQSEFDWDLSATEIREVIQTPIGRYELIKDQVPRNGWIENMTINNFTGRSKIKLIMNQDANI